jgi:DtxR family transcriptional regulator, Mn-dependent transcriptional regulator
MRNLHNDVPANPMQSSSLEDYLETILILSQAADGETGITEIGERLGVSKPSVSTAIKRLAARNLVKHEHYGRVRLTEQGRTLAEEVIRRHELLVRFLRDVLRLDEATAQEDACKLEHQLSAETTARLAKFVEFLAGSDESASNRDFLTHLANGKNHEQLVQKQE